MLCGTFHMVELAYVERSTWSKLEQLGHVLSSELSCAWNTGTIWNVFWNKYRVPGRLSSRSFRPGHQCILTHQAHARVILRGSSDIQSYHRLFRSRLLLIVVVVGCYYVLPADLALGSRGHLGNKEQIQDRALRCHP